MIAPVPSLSTVSNVQTLSLRGSPSPLSAEPMVESDALLKGQREVLILHGDRVYRLRHTSNDKLILTK